MSKTNARWIDFGTGADQVDDSVVPSSLSPTSYTPTQIGSEGTDKISAHLNGIDLKFSTLAASFADEFFTGDGSTTDFQLASTITSETVMEVYWNGVLQEETADWTRDIINDQVDISPALLANTRIRVRIYSLSIFNDYKYTADGIGTIYSPPVDITNSQKIDVFMNGQLLEESSDYYRDPDIEAIVMFFTPAANSRIRIRIFN